MQEEIYITSHVEAIKQRALFLKKKGFSLIEVSEFIMKFSCEKCCLIEIYYGRYTDNPNVFIRFENKGEIPEQYGVEWLRTLERFQSEEKFQKNNNKVDKLIAIFSLLDYLEQNFDNVTDIEYCRVANQKIEENFQMGLWDIWFTEV